MDINDLIMLNYWKFILAGIFWSYSKSCAVEMLFQTICVHSIWYSSIFISFPTNTQPNQDCRQFKLQLTIDLSSQGCLSRMQSMLVRKQKILINVLCMLHEFIINRSFRWRPVKDVCPAGRSAVKASFLPAQRSPGLWILRARGGRQIESRRVS